MIRTIAVAMLLLAGHAAYGTVIDVTATGYLSDNQPTNPYFASTFPTDRTLYGKSATIELQIDTSLAGLDILGGSVAGRAAYAGGSCPGLGANWIRTTAITIAGVSFGSLSPGTGNVSRCDIAEVWDQSLNGRFDSFTAQDFESSTETVPFGGAGGTLTRATQASISFGLTSTLVDFVTGLSLDQPFTFAALPELANAQIVFSEDDTTCGADGTTCSRTRVVNVNEDIKLQSVTFTTATVPEPTTLALFAAGVLLLLPRQRRRA